ncbi:MAG: type III-B CRISPR module-associated Cmr3 family protein [Oscillochloridaceae bacterium umkhey_bin13]
MPLLHFQIEALAPLAFPERKPGVQFNASLPYVPGAAIYGALGQQFGPDGFDSELFRSLRCHNAYPARPTDAWVRPLPATAIQPKGAGKATTPTDSLVARVAWEIQQPTALIYAPTDNDGRPYEAVSTKFYSLMANNQLDYREVQQRMLTRVAINRQRGTAQDSRLYSPLAISEVTIIDNARVTTGFVGTISCNPADQQRLSAALTALTHLGGRQTSGLGAVQITLHPTPLSPDGPEAIMQRITALTKRFQAQMKVYTALGGQAWPQPIADTSIFTVNLLSDAILYEHGWLPTQEFSAQQLEEAIGIKATLLRAFTTTKPVGGWHTLWQRPKPSAIAVAMGGLYVFQAATPLDANACVRLAQLQLDGIGDRRSEGFGQVRICDEFHLLHGETSA